MKQARRNCELSSLINSGEISKSVAVRQNWISISRSTASFLRARLAEHSQRPFPMRASISRMHPSLARRGDTLGSRLTEFEFPGFRLSGRLLSALFNYPPRPCREVYNVVPPADICPTFRLLPPTCNLRYTFPRKSHATRVTKTIPAVFVQNSKEIRWFNASIATKFICHALDDDKICIVLRV